MTSTSSFSNHQPTPFYIDNILGSTPTASSETDSSTRQRANGINNDQEQGPINEITNSASPIVSVASMMIHHTDGLLPHAANCLQGSSPNNGLTVGLQPSHSPYHPVLSSPDSQCNNAFLTSSSPSLENGLSPSRHNQVTRPIFPTPVQAVPAHHPMLGYTTPGYSRSSNLYEPTVPSIQSPYNQAPLQYNPSPYGGPPTHAGPRLDPYSYPRHDYWFLDRQAAAFNKGMLFQCG